MTHFRFRTSTVVVFFKLRYSSILMDKSSETNVFVSFVSPFPSSKAFPIFRGCHSAKFQSNMFQFQHLDFMISVQYVSISTSLFLSSLLPKVVLSLFRRPDPFSDYTLDLCDQIIAVIIIKYN